MRPPIDWLALSPELALLGASAICLLAAVIGPRPLRTSVAAVVAAAGFVGAFACAVVLYAETPNGETVIAGAIRRDRYSAFAMLLVAGAGLLTVAISHGDRREQQHGGEFYMLLAACGAGMCFFVQTNNLITLFLGLEWLSICLYILCAIDLDRVGSLEAGLKYLVVGSFGSAVLLFGSALVYGATGHLDFNAIKAATAAHGLKDDALLLAGLAMMLTGFGFKASAAPFHMWTPDVYEGAPTSVTAFMAAATKTVAVVVMLRVLVTAFPQESDLWTAGVAALVCVSLAWGNLAALVQPRLKRMLAYSSISHAGFLLIAVAADSQLGGRALLYYLIPYGAASIGAFAVVAARERELNRPATIENISGFGWERPVLGVSMATFMLAFAGLPPTGGFTGKLYVFSAAYDAGKAWLVIVGVVATTLSLYYYLSVIRAMFMRPSAELQVAAAAGGSPPREALLQSSVVVSFAIVIASFFLVEPLATLAKHAANSIPLPL
jgi:NADH-quinone oxidoreductase subunit N